MRNSPAERAITREFFVVNYPSGSATSRYLQSVIDRIDAIDCDSEEFLPYTEDAKREKFKSIARYSTMKRQALEFEEKYGVNLAMKDIEIEQAVTVDTDHQDNIIKEVIESLVESGVNPGMATEITMLIKDGLINHVLIEY